MSPVRHSLLVPAWILALLALMAALSYASEIVVPLIRDGRILGVIDLDSPLPARFDLDDQRGIEAVAGIYLRSSADL